MFPWSSHIVLIQPQNRHRPIGVVFSAAESVKAERRALIEESIQAYKGWDPQGSPSPVGS